MRYAALFLLLAACKPQPSSIELTGEEQVTVHTMDPVNLPAATVKAKDGAALEDKATWTVEKPEVAKIEGDKLIPLAEGETKVTATSGAIHKDFVLKVAMPDKVEIAGAPAGNTVEEGGTVDLTAKVMDGETAMDKMDVTWSSSDPTIATVEGGKVTTLKAGEVKITATSGALSVDQPLTVTPKAAGEATAEGAAPAPEGAAPAPANP